MDSDASYPGLGVVLMAVSFACQKDWLSLREAMAADPPDAGAASGETAQ